MHAVCSTICCEHSSSSLLLWYFQKRIFSQLWNNWEWSVVKIMILLVRFVKSESLHVITTLLFPLLATVARAWNRLTGWDLKPEQNDKPHPDLRCENRVLKLVNLTSLCKSWASEAHEVHDNTPKLCFGAASRVQLIIAPLRNPCFFPIQTSKHRNISTNGSYLLAQHKNFLLYQDSSNINPSSFQC